MKSIDEIKPGGGKSVILGADASASSNLIFAVIAKEVLGLNVNIVRGYTGAAPHVPGDAERRARRSDSSGLSSIKSGQRDLYNRKRSDR